MKPFFARQLSSTAYSRQATSFSKSFPKKPLKAWEKAGEDKETFFKKRYAHVHAEQLKSRDNFQIEKDRLKKRLQKSETEKPIRALRKHRSMQAKNYVGKFQNPLTEFVYGTSAVQSALVSSKRGAHSRLILQGSNAADSKLIKLATERGVQVTNMDKHHMNILSNYSPHNGVILETKPIVLPILEQLGSSQNNEYSVYIDENGAIVELDSLRVLRGHGHPLGVLVDEVTDPHNIGAIIRLAYFLGADFVAVCEKNCALLNSVVAKTASGALDAMPMYLVLSPLGFVEKSKRNGWTFVSTSVSKETDSVNADDLKGVLQDSPCVLVLGSEGYGLRKSLSNLCDVSVTLEGRSDGLVDSLNVSVAAGLLLSKFM